MLEFVLSVFMKFQQPGSDEELMWQLIRHPDWALISLRSMAWHLHHDRATVVYDKCWAATHRWRPCKQLAGKADFDACSFAVGHEFCAAHWEAR
jgi:hypothetical protein